MLHESQIKPQTHRCFFLCVPHWAWQNIFFSWLKVFDGKEGGKKAPVVFCVELLHRTAASFQASVTLCPASPAPVRFTQIHLKESHFHACYENSFLTLITLLLPLRTKCSLLKLISQQGLLSKNSDVPSYHLWSMGLRENLLWINCKYHLPNFYLDISLMLTWAFMAICRVQLIMAHISVPTYVCLACFMTFSAAALKRDRCAKV